jgi:hypothetical protein
MAQTISFDHSGAKFQWTPQKLQVSGASFLLNAPVLPLNSERYDLVEMQGIPTLKTPGLPQWPYQSFIVQGDAHELSIEIEHGKAIAVSSNPILPAAQMPCRCSKRIPSWFERSNHPLLKSHVMVESLGIFRGQALSKITITPFYQDGDGTWMVEDLSVYVQGAETFDLKNILDRTQSERLLVIGPRELLDHFDDFAAYYEEKGMTLEYLTVAPNMSIARLTSQVREIYEAVGFGHALILGDETQVPMHHRRTFVDPMTPTDLFTFTFDGADDVIPDVIYARLVASDGADLRAQFARIREFTERSFERDNGLSRGIMVSSDEGFNPTDVEYSRRMMAPHQRASGGQEKTFDFFVQGQRNARAQDIISSFNRGAVWMNYIGHGEGDRWPSITGAALTVDQFSSFTGRDVLPIVIDVACQNGRLSFDRRIGVELMRKRHSSGRQTGALAYYGGTVDISWHPPAQMAVYINELAAAREYATLGEVLLAGQFKLLENYDDLPSALENLVWYHLQGDPLLPIDF